MSAFDIGTRVKTIAINRQYVDQQGTVIGYDGRLQYVVMDEPSLHTHDYFGVKCCGFYLESLINSEYIIEELVL